MILWSQQIFPSVLWQCAMCISRKGNNNWNWKFMLMDRQQVSQFRYLGSLISEDGYCTKEIRSRIEMAKKVFMEKKKPFTDKINLELKKRIMKCLVNALDFHRENLCSSPTDPRVNHRQCEKRRLANVTYCASQDPHYTHACLNLHNKREYVTLRGLFVRTTGVRQHQKWSNTLPTLSALTSAVLKLCVHQH